MLNGGYASVFIIHIINFKTIYKQKRKKIKTNNNKENEGDVKCIIYVSKTITTRKKNNRKFTHWWWSKFAVTP